MSKPVWNITQPSNSNLGTFIERKSIGVDNVPAIELKVSGVTTVSIISGRLPGGLRIEGLKIIGTPFAVIGSVTSRFVLRAKNTDGISDRTFTITIASVGESILWETPTGSLPIGPNHHYYILDNSWVDFQLDAIDQDVPNSKYLNYHIPPNGGELPGGITLSSTGRLSGYTAPLLAVETGGVSGNFDSTLYDKFGYDYGVRPMNGYDSFYFDNTTFDFSNPNRAPRKLNRYYQFKVRASDGLYFVDRTFRIYVVGDDYMRADNDILHVGTNTYSADNTYMRKPIWITKNYIGRLRANNYITVMLDVFDPATLEGNIGYILASNNNEALAKATWDSNIPVILTHASNLTGQPRVIQVAEIYHLTLGLTVYVSNGAGSFNSGTTITAIDEQYKRITVSTDVKEPLANATIYAINPTASLTLNPASIAGEIKEGYQVECTTDPVFILDIEKTDLNTGYLTSLGFTTKLKVNMPITFSGTSFGNIITDIIYYVRSVVDSKNFTISDSLDGPIYSVTTGTGLLSVSTPSSKIPADAVVTGWNPETNILSIKWDSPNTVSMTKSGLLRMGSVSRLPPGMILDSLSGEIYGSVPSQSAITINYKFTVIALRYSVDPTVPNVSSYRTFSVDIMGEIDSVIHFTTSGDLGSIDANFISNLNVNAITTIPDAVLTYRLISGKIPPGISLVNDGTLQGKVNQFSDGIIYKAIWKSNRSYTLNNVVTHLGKKYKCTTIHTSSNNFNSAYWITYVEDATTAGIITFDNNQNYYDGFTTVFDKSYTFTVEARDQFNKSATTKTFKLVINTPNDKLYSNIYLKPLLKKSTRESLTAFFNDPNVFEPKSIYRQSDPNFGIQTEFKMLLYSGIESKVISAYVSAFGRSYKKKFRIGNLKKAIAKKPGTNEVTYEVVYLEILDNLENENGSVSAYIKTAILDHVISINQGRRDIDINSMSIDQLSRMIPSDKTLTIDFGGQKISDSNKSNIFGNSVTNMRNILSSIGDTERKYLPLWMRTPQTFSGIEQGFTKAVPICYCLPGTADNMILNIKNSGFDFKMVDYTIDRAIIDSVIGNTGDKYIAFAAREVING